jgi:hypothetical protein
MAEPQPSKLAMRVRFPSSAPMAALGRQLAQAKNQESLASTAPTSPATSSPTKTEIPLMLVLTP